MCGFFGLHSFQLDKNKKIIISRKAIESLRSRGPDHNDIWLGDNDSLIFSHNRLSILDLSDKGNQPMISSSGNLVIIYNGEIYNHLDIRTELKKNSDFSNWRGKSDTETLLQALEFWGIEKTLEQINGMFAFIVWDKKKKILYLARDRFGEKPLYYGWISQIKSFVFSSDLIFDKLFNNLNFQINDLALNDLFKLNYINNDYSIFKNIFKIKPGDYAKVSFEKNSEPKIIIKNYWNSKNVILNKSIPDEKTDFVNKLDDILTNVIKNQTLADVEVGTFLSGGIDSSLVTAKVQEISSNKVKTFSIGNENKSYDESKYAKQVAKYLNTDHEELIISDKEIVDKIPNILSHLNEPIGDSSFIPTYLVSELAKKKVKVSLTGDAGDEIFGGYNRYTKIKTMNYFYKLPKVVKKIISKSHNLLNQKNLNYLNIVIKLLPFYKNEFYLDEKIRKILLRIDPNQTQNDFLLSFFMNESSKNNVIKTEFQSNHNILENFNKVLDDQKFSNISIEEKMMYLDTINYLPNDILFKVDRASMANSLETRAPFLDKDLYEFSVNLPFSLKIKNGKGKYILRKILKNKIPNNLIDRPKAGFSIPIGQWIKKPLLDWSENLLSKKNIEKSGLLNFNNIEKIWKLHKNGYDHSSILWSILVFQEWLINRK